MSFEIVIFVNHFFLRFLYNNICYQVTIIIKLQLFNNIILFFFQQCNYKKFIEQMHFYRKFLTKVVLFRKRVEGNKKQNIGL